MCQVAAGCHKRFTFCAVSSAGHVKRMKKYIIDIFQRVKLSQRPRGAKGSQTSEPLLDALQPSEHRAGFGPHRPQGGKSRFTWPTADSPAGWCLMRKQSSRRCCLGERRERAQMHVRTTPDFKIGSSEWLAAKGDNQVGVDVHLSLIAVKLYMHSIYHAYIRDVVIHASCGTMCRLVITDFIKFALSSALPVSSCHSSCQQLSAVVSCCQLLSALSALSALSGRSAHPHLHLHSSPTPNPPATTTTLCTPPCTRQHRPHAPPPAPAPEPSHGVGGRRPSQHVIIHSLTMSRDGTCKKPHTLPKLFSGRPYHPLPLAHMDKSRQSASMPAMTLAA